MLDIDCLFLLSISSSERGQSAAAEDPNNCFPAKPLQEGLIAAKASPPLLYRGQTTPGRLVAWQRDFANSFHALSLLPPPPQPSPLSSTHSATEQDIKRDRSVAAAKLKRFLTREDEDEGESTLVCR